MCCMRFAQLPECGDVMRACPYRSGVEKRTHFLRDVAHSAAIRKHLIGNWNKANLPSAQHPLACSVLHKLMLSREAV